MNIYILKLKSSNWPSVEKSLINLKYAPITIDVSSVVFIKKGSILIIPGVGNIKSLSNEIEENIGIEVLKDFIFKNEIRTIGICLGFQFLCKSSEEDKQAKCLNIFNLKVESIHTPNKPSVGWKNLKKLENNQRSFDRIKCIENNYFYFTHSYAVLDYKDDEHPEYEKYTYEIDNGKQIIGAILGEKLIGYQFHPEKSADKGLELMAASIEYLSKN